MIDFAGFVEATAGFQPYPWQIEFARRCVDDPSPPPLVNVPTGAGKTTVARALIWALAQQSDRSACDRSVGVRTLWTIDRRILVDDVFNDWIRTAQRLSDAAVDSSDELHEIALALLSIADGTRVDSVSAARGVIESGASPLVVSRWRGDLEAVPEHVTPLQPQIIATTAAQVGSRVLFRGFGVSRRSQAIAAGLTAIDTNICLDEVHLVEPLRQTLKSISRRRDTERTRTATPPMNTIIVSATPPDKVQSPEVTLSPADVQLLGSRFSGAKWATLREADKDTIDQLVSAVDELIDDGHTEVACVVNRVATARRVFDVLAKRTSTKTKTPDGECAIAQPKPYLVFGPQRPADRASEIEECWPRLGTSPQEVDNAAQPVVVIATQAIEVGLDISVSGMVTQSASASALIQRFGRLNRFGDGRGPGTAIVVRDPDPWLYKDDESSCWQWLESMRVEDRRIDISVKALTTASPPQPSRPDRAPMLTDAVVTQLIQTNPRPAPLAEPDIEPFLRGITSETSEDVDLAWRCDLREADTTEHGAVYRETLMAAAPILRAERLSLSIVGARQFLTRLAAGKAGGAALKSEADISGLNPADERPDTNAPAAAPAALVVRADEVFELLFGGSRTEVEPARVIRLRELRPGDTVVLPCAFGGVDRHGLTITKATGTATDVSLQAINHTAGKPSDRIRVNRDVITYVLKDPSADDVNELFNSMSRTLAERSDGTDLAVPSTEFVGIAEIAPEGDKLREILSRLGMDDESKWSIRLVPDSIDDESLDNDATDPETARVPSGTWLFERQDSLAADRRAIRAGGARLASVSLEAHSRDVADRVGQWSMAIGLDESKQATLRLAALAHDLGKADPRIQAWFAGGSWSPGMELLAKSTYGADDRSMSRRSRRLAGVPSGLRHEQGSVAILADAIACAAVDVDVAEFDADLAIHLVGTHHGNGRPLPPVMRTDGRAPSPYGVCSKVLGIVGSANGDADDSWKNGVWFSQFFTLNRSYGAWTLAYLEATLVLADRLVSAEGK